MTIFRGRSGEWLNTTCTLYRREALPQPPFPSNFTGYSLMEDLALSLTVGKHWKLANARTARIYHDSQSGSTRTMSVAVSGMELVNRHYVMTQGHARRGVRDYAKLALWELFQLAVCAHCRSAEVSDFWRELRGKLLGLCNILTNQTDSATDDFSQAPGCIGRRWHRHPQQGRRIAKSHYRARLEQSTRRYGSRSSMMHRRDQTPALRHEFKTVSWERWEPGQGLRSGAQPYDADRDRRLLRQPGRRFLVYSGRRNCYRCRFSRAASEGSRGSV